jgi:hypothetical protein
MALAPAIMIQRNIASIDKAVISTNLGVTMNIGAGPDTKGGYAKTGESIPCEPLPPATSVTDNELVKCVIKWYVTHPAKTLQLSWSKSVYFWSPWSGPVANGTMARNPWQKINPIVDIAQRSEDGNKLVYGNIGKVVSWLWVGLGLMLLFAGFFALCRLGNLEKALGLVLLTPILASWISAIGTIGDHRFRVPTMSLSLVLQVIGFFTLKKRIIK